MVELSICLDGIKIPCVEIEFRMPPSNDSLRHNDIMTGKLLGVSWEVYLKPTTEKSSRLIDSIVKPIWRIGNASTIHFLLTDNQYAVSGNMELIAMKTDSSFIYRAGFQGVLKPEVIESNTE